MAAALHIGLNCFGFMFTIDCC